MAGYQCHFWRRVLREWLALAAFKCALLCFVLCLTKCSYSYLVVSLTGNRLKAFQLNWKEKKFLQIPARTQYNRVPESTPSSFGRSKSPVLTATFQPGQNSFYVTSSGIRHPDCKLPARGFSVLWDNGLLFQGKGSSNNVQCYMNSSRFSLSLHCSHKHLWKKSWIGKQKTYIHVCKCIKLAHENTREGLAAHC